ncbi:MAG: DUF456 domain-containing protein [Deltaproteobacteria bacterium]|nr:DUF456 domain-containing protein [Deltaproteobacteria bacterium]
MPYVYAAIITLANAVFCAGILFGLPGTWLMLVFPLVLAWWQPGLHLFSPAVLWSAAGLAALGEVLEFTLGAAGSRREGGSGRAAALALVGGVIGGVLGTAIPVPVVGTLLGACLGAFAGSLAGDLWAGRSLFRGLRAGRAAAVGRLYGTLSKLAVGAAIFLVLVVSAFL